MDSWEFMRIRGIPLRVHPSWFLILILFTWTAEGQLSKAVDNVLPFWLSWGVGLKTALLLFLSVVLHELGHSFMALHEGVKVRSITLFFLGGMANLDSTGRLAAAHPAFVTMGGAIGPMVMGYISDYGGFSLVGWFAMAMILISIPMVISGTKAADQKL